MTEQRTLDNSEPKNKGKVDPRNKLNDLTGKQWLFFTRSVWNTAYASKYGHKLRKQHYANKPPELMEKIIRFFTKKNQRVLDPFAGVGGTLLGASLCERRAVGIEINAKWVDIYHQVCKEENIRKQTMLTGDCRHLLDTFDTPFDFVVTDPPYFQISTEKTSSDQQNNTNMVDEFSDKTGDLGNITDYTAFLNQIGDIFAKILNVLKKDAYAVVFLKNRYIDGKFYSIAYDTAKILENVGYTWRGEHIWNQQGQRIYPFGYPYAYIPNTVHHNVLVFRNT